MHRRAQTLLGTGYVGLSPLVKPAAPRPGPVLSPASAEVLACLTPAERMVAVHLAQGLSNKEIAAALGRALPTVKHQVSAAMRKLRVQSRYQLIVRLLRS